MTLLTPSALDFLSLLHDRFNDRRLELLKARQVRQQALSQGEKPGFLPRTREIRSSAWTVAPAPRDLDDRRVEITGPVERKMMINALNSGAKVFMADFEDATSPTWENLMVGQQNCHDAVRRTLSFKNPDGKEYKLNAELATLVVRPRGWHLDEAHLQRAGKPMSGSLVDFGLYFFHNAAELLKRGSGPYFYLPKIESHLEARLWNDVFVFAQKHLGIPHGSIRATVLIETILAAYEMEEILYELRDHAAGLNAGRWDYIFSVIKKFRDEPTMLFPDRAQVTMGVPFMRSYAELLVRTCHRRGAHAIGGMAAFIPSRRDEAVNKNALAKVREDKEREATMGFDGTWVAHPDLVPIAQEIFDAHIGGKTNQKNRVHPDLKIEPAQLIDTRIPGAKITETGVRINVDVALQYLEGWLRGIGAAAIHNLMEDAATAEISRAELWQWIHHQARLDDGRTMSTDLYGQVRGEELSKLRAQSTHGRWGDAAEILDQLVLNREFPDFLTTLAYPRLVSKDASRTV